MMDRRMATAFMLKTMNIKIMKIILRTAATNLAFKGIIKILLFTGNAVTRRSNFPFTRDKIILTGVAD